VFSNTGSDSSWPAADAPKQRTEEATASAVATPVENESTRITATPRARSPRRRSSPSSSRRRSRSRSRSPQGKRTRSSSPVRERPHRRSRSPEQAFVRREARGASARRYAVSKSQRSPSRSPSPLPAPAAGPLPDASCVASQVCTGHEENGTCTCKSCKLFAALSRMAENQHEKRLIETVFYSAMRLARE
jgi:hypothetical protein